MEDILAPNTRNNSYDMGPLYERAVLSSMFPDLRQGRHRVGKINLNDVVQFSVITQNLDDWWSPSATQKIIDDFTTNNNLLYTYGGWLERRDFLWKHACLKEGQKFLHLGVDINVPQGIRVHSPVYGTVIHTDPNFGSGVTLGTSIAIQSGQKVFIYAHLDSDLSVKTGQHINVNQLLGTVGTWPNNGNVFNHVLIQALPVELYREHMKSNFANFNNYGYIGDEKKLELEYRSPLLALSKLMLQLK